MGGTHGRVDINDEHWQGNGEKADICRHRISRGAYGSGREKRVSKVKAKIPECMSGAFIYIRRRDT